MVDIYGISRDEAAAAGASERVSRMPSTGAGRRAVGRTTVAGVIRAGLVGLALVACVDRADAFQLTSQAFTDGGTVPTEHTCDGPDKSPPLAWKDAPERTMAFALVCEDPDAPAKTWVHWVAYDLPATEHELAAGLPKGPSLPNGGKQGMNDFRRTGWNGPCPPPGPAHRYVFTLYALDAKVDLPAGAARDKVGAAIAGHTLGQAQLVGRYARKQ